MRLLPGHPLSPLRLAPLFARMLVPKRNTEQSTWNAINVTGDATPISRRHLQRYLELCGFTQGDVLPLTYPHLLALPLHLKVLTHPDFPISLPGTVHLSNHIEQQRDILSNEKLTVSVTTPEPEQTSRGREFSLLTVAFSAGQEVWRGVSTMLRPNPGPHSRAARPKPVEGWGDSETWQLPADLGRRYARVSGDFNPIHLSPLSARLFGFRRPIIHGMWSCARCVAVLPSSLVTGAVTLDVQFRRPLSLPGAVCFQSLPAGDHTEFQLVNPQQSERYLLGRISRGIIMPRDA